MKPGRVLTLPTRTSRRAVMPATSGTSRARQDDHGLAQLAGGFLMACADCGLSGGPFTAGEALVLAGEHDRIHHRGVHTAEATDQLWCESCRIRPAATSYSPPSAGSITAAADVEPRQGDAGDGPVPFRVCHDCATSTPPPPPDDQLDDVLDGQDDDEGAPQR
jgi:hypothetical protein